MPPLTLPSPPWGEGIEARPCTVLLAQAALLLRKIEFRAEAAARELLRQKQLRALQQARGAWAARSHGDLSGTSALFVRKLRAENERRLRRLRGRA